MLNNVSKWNPNLGLKHITAQEAYAETNSKVGSNKRIFFCETCGQSVALFLYNGKTPTFRHPNNSKECEDKITAYNLLFNEKTNPLGFSLPLRIMPENDSIEIQIGFLPLSTEVLNSLKQDNFEFQVINEKGALLKKYVSERLSDTYINYLSVGNSISRYYILKYNNDIIKAEIWPTVVDGISPTGTLFDKSSGKRLPRNAEVVVDRDYWLLTQDITIFNNDVIISDKRKYQDWYLYLIKAQNFSQKVAMWFLQYGVRLADKPAKVTPIWPIVNRSPHCLTFSADKLMFYKTAGIVDIYPLQKRCTKSEGIFYINNQQTEQFISMSRFVSDNRKNVIKYTLVRYKKPIPHNMQSEENLVIKDKDNKLIYSGEYNKLPEDNKIYVESYFDGFIKQEQGNCKIKRIKLKAATNLALDVQFGHVIKIFQGLDCVAKISFVKSAVIGNSDEALFRELSSCGGERLPITHTLGALADNLVNMPKTQHWLLQQIRTKTISQTALKILQKRLEKM